TFTNLSHNVAANITINFTSGSLSNTISTTIAISPAAFVKLQLLAPGESSAPGTVSGKSGTPAAQTAAVPFNVTVNAVDAFWNFVNTVADNVGITASSDSNAILPANAALNGGTQTFSVT